MTNKALSWALGIACAVIVALSIHIVHTEYYHHAQSPQVPSYCQSYEALEKFKTDHPTMMITCDNEPE